MQMLGESETLIFSNQINLLESHINHIRPVLHMDTLTRSCQFDMKFRKSETDQYIFPKLCTHIHNPFSTYLSHRKKEMIILVVLLGLNINRGMYINFSSFLGILMHYTS